MAGGECFRVRVVLHDVLDAGKRPRRPVFERDEPLQSAVRTHVRFAGNDIVRDMLRCGWVCPHAERHPTVRATLPDDPDPCAKAVAGHHIAERGFRLSCVGLG